MVCLYKKKINILNVFICKFFYRYHKGPSNLRCKSVKIPSIDRYYAEQIVAYLITESYLREDFNFTPYSTISYIRQGHKDANKQSVIMFYGARILGLPNIGNSISLNTEIMAQISTDNGTSTSTRVLSTDDDVVFVSEAKSNKKRKSSKYRNLDHSTSSSSSRRSSSTTKHDKSGSRHRRRESKEGTSRLENRRSQQSSINSSDADQQSDSSLSISKKSRLSKVVAEALANESKRRKTVSGHVEVRIDNNDDLLVLQQNGVVIEID